MVRPEEPRVAVLLQQQVVHVLGRLLEGVAGGRTHGLPRRLHRLAVDVDLSLGAGRQKFTMIKKDTLCKCEMFKNTLL